MAIWLSGWKDTDVLPLGWGRRAVELENLEYLINFTVTAEERLLFDKLSKDASNCPDIHTQTVLPLSKEDFRCAVPEGLNLMCESLDGNSKSARKPKICNFEHSCIRYCVPFLSIKRFCGLRSRWMMRREWQKFMPFMSWNMIRRIWF